MKYNDPTARSIIQSAEAAAAGAHMSLNAIELPEHIFQTL